MYYTEKQCLQNELQIMHPIALRAKLTALHHFKHRHDGRTSKPARQYLAEYRKAYRADTRARLAAIEAGAPMRAWCEQTGQWK
jgi:hypothetical protein